MGYHDSIMDFIEPEELEGKVRRKGRKSSPLGDLLREIPMGKSVIIDTEVDDIKNPLSAYTIAKSIGKKVQLNKIDETTWAITCISSETIEKDTNQ